MLILRQGRLALDARLEKLTQGSCLQLRCEASAEQALERLASLPGVAHVELQSTIAGICTFRLQAQNDLAQTAAEVAAAVVNAGWKLYSLQNEERSLEKIFHEITAKEVTADAA